MVGKSQSVEEIISKFTVKHLPKIDGEPTYESINQWMQLLYANAATLPTTLGGGRHGHIGMIMQPALYATLSTVAYNTPTDPGPLPIFRSTDTDQARQETSNEFYENKRVFENHFNMDQALKLLIIEAIDAVYIDERRDRYTAFLNVSARDLMNHLLHRYGKITATDMKENKQKMEEPIDTSEPIDKYFKRIDDCAQFATDANTAFTTEQILQTAYYAITTTGLYTDACKEWRRKPEDQKTWENFKRFFAEEYHDLKEQQRTTSMQAGYHQANMMEESDTSEFMNAFQNFAHAATTDKNTIAHLVEANAKLVESNKILTNQLAEAIQKLNLRSQVSNNNKKSNDFSTKRTQNDWQMDPMGYCWTHGYKVRYGHNSATCTNKRKGHRDEANRKNIMGGSTQNRYWNHPSQDQCNNVEHYKNDNHSNNQLSDYSFDLNNVKNTRNPQENQYAIVDSGASDHYIEQNIAKSYEPKHDMDVISVKLPNGNTLHSNGKCTIPFKKLPNSTKNGHVLPGLKNSLISVGKLCDSNLTTVFTKEKVWVCNKKFKIPSKQILLEGTRDEQNGLWTTKLPKREPQKALNFDHYKNTTSQNLILFLYYAAFSPAISTLIKAVKKGFFTTWPGFTVQAIKKYVANEPTTSKGHLDHVRKNLRSTKSNKNYSTINRTSKYDPPPITKMIYDNEIEDVSQEPENIITNDHYLGVTDIKKVYSDQTGRFPYRSSNGMQYCFVLYSYDTNAILVEPLKNRTAQELLKAYSKIITYLSDRGYKPNMHFLDNEAPDILQRYNIQQKIKYQLVPPNSHRRNAAERAIRTWKNHFISGLCTVNPNFPIHLWDRLIPQSVMTLNMLRPSRRNQNISAYTALNGMFNFDATPLAPPGCKVVIYEAPSNRTSFSPHGTDAWYIGPTLKHYRCYKTYVTKTRAERICDSLTFHPHNCETPSMSPHDQIIIAATDLTKALNNPQYIPAKYVQENDTLTALQSLSNIFNKILQKQNHFGKNKIAESPRVINRSFKQNDTPPAPQQHTRHVTSPINRSETPTTNNDNTCNNQINENHRPHQYNTRYSIQKYGACAVIDPDTGKTLQYKQLIQHPKHKNIWNTSMSNEIGRLAQGNKNVKGTNTMFFLPFEEIPINRKKDITYARIVVDYRPQKTEKERTRITVGGNLINYPDNVSTKTAEVTTAKIMFNSVISTKNARFGVMDIGNFYLGTPMERYEYMFLNIKDIPEDIIEK